MQTPSRCQNFKGKPRILRGEKKIIKSGITEIRGNTSACLRSKEKRRHETIYYLRGNLPALRKRWLSIIRTEILLRKIKSHTRSRQRNQRGLLTRTKRPRAHFPFTRGKVLHSSGAGKAAPCGVTDSRPSRAPRSRAHTLPTCRVRRVGT